MTPLFFVAATMIVAGNSRKTRRRKSKGGGVAGPRKTAPSRFAKRGAGKALIKSPHAKKGNGKIKQVWTSFPWEPDRVNEVAEQLLGSGETDPAKLTIAVAKMVYPVHPISGMEFPWPPDAKGKERDIGAQMIYSRIRLRVNTLVAATEERMADEATAHMAQEPPALTEGDAEVVAGAPADAVDVDEPTDEPADEPTDEEEEEEEDDDAPEAEQPSNPRIGRASPMPFPEPARALQRRRRPLTLARGRRGMQRRPQVDPLAYHPEDNSVRDGVYHRVDDHDTIHDLARTALSAMGEPSEGDVAQYVSLIVCSPANEVPTTWDDDHELPGADPQPWGDERPILWLPKLNDTSLAAGVVTTLGVLWSDGSNGITPPPGTHGRGNA